MAPMIKAIISLLNFAFKWWKDVNMLIANMIWKELSQTNSLKMIQDNYTYEYYIKMQSINLFKQSQVFSVLCIYNVQKLASVPYSSLQIKRLGLIYTVRNFRNFVLNLKT